MRLWDFCHRSETRGQLGPAANIASGWGVRVVLILLLLATSLPVWAHHQSYRIGLFTTRSAGDAYWGQVEDFMRAASQDLGLELQVFYAGGDHIALIKQFETAVLSDPPFDALVLPNFKKTAHRNIKTAETHRVPVLLFNSGVSSEREEEVGQPREKYRYWIGSILPDEQQAGAELFNWLSLAAQSTANPSKKPAVATHSMKVPLVAIGGNLADFASIERSRGLELALAKQERFGLAQLVHADWQRQRAAEMFSRLIKRYPDTGIAWAASDLMALGVQDSAKRAGVSIVTGGVDWTREGLSSVLEGGLSVSVGGHFMDGGWAAVMLYDYFHGVDFADESPVIVTPMVPLSAANKEHINLLLNSPDWARVDFSRYSKALNPELKRYAFYPRSVFPQLR